MFRNLFKYILCFVILIYAVYLHDCKDGWKSFADSCYHLSLDKRDWSSSKMYCESEGSVLVQADTTEEIDFLMTMLSDQLMLGSFDNANIWIGTWNNTTIGNFTWVDGSTVKERRHASENIDGCPSLINGNEKDQWLAETAECSRRFFHICETNKTVSRSGLVKPLTKNDSSTQSHCNEGWFAFKDSRYLLSREPRTWYSSKIHCETIGTRLVTIGTVSEYTILTGIHVCEKNFWIGSPNVYNPETRSVMSSSAFDPDIPANESQCIILNKGWAITDCEDKYPSICEKNETQKSLGGEELLNFSLPIDQVSRNCEYLQKDKQKEYEKSNVSFEDLYDKVFNSSDYDPVNVLKQLKNATYAYKENNETLPSDRLINVVKMMSKLAESMDLNNSKALTEDSLKPYLEIISNLLGDHTFYSWIVIINQTGKGANKLIDGFKSIMSAEDESANKAFARDCEYRPTDKQKKRFETNVSVKDLFYKVNNSSDYDKEDVLNQLNNVTAAFKENNETVPSDTIIMILKMITKLAGGVDLNDPKSLTKESLKPYLEIVSNLLGDHTKAGWNDIINQTGSGANELLDGVEKFMTNLNETDVVESINNKYVVKASLRDCDNGIHFPNHTDMALPAWLAKTKNKIFLNCDKDSNSYVGIIFNSIESSFPSTYGPEMDLQHELNSAVISFSLIPKPEGKLKHPIEITFQTLKKELDDPKCVYWKNIEGSQGYWSSEGCWLHQYMRQDGVIVCKCNHLTSFAVLMSLSPGLASHHNKVLSIITQIGLTISMVFLALNVFIYILFWRYVKSAQSIMKLNLSCVLFLANLIFLIGIDKTTNEVVCSTVAVLLHLLYLMVFFVMLVLGLHMLNGVLNPTYLGDNTLRNLLASYGTAVFVVAVSVGSTQLKGYGTDKYCWLSTETGLIWAFLIPVIVIITINFTIVVVVFKIMFNTTKMTRETSFNRVKAGVRGFIVLLPVMGLTWIIGIFAFDSNMVVFHYLFSILNSLQGFFIFILHCVMNEKIRKAVEKLRPHCIRSTVSDTKTTAASNGQN